MGITEDQLMSKCEKWYRKNKLPVSERWPVVGRALLDILQCWLDDNKITHHDQCTTILDPSVVEQIQHMCEYFASTGKATIEK